MKKIGVWTSVFLLVLLSFISFSSLASDLDRYQDDESVKFGDEIKPIPVRSGTVIRMSREDWQAILTATEPTTEGYTEDYFNDLQASGLNMQSVGQERRVDNPASIEAVRQTVQEALAQSGDYITVVSIDKAKTNTMATFVENFNSPEFDKDEVSTAEIRIGIDLGANQAINLGSNTILTFDENGNLFGHTGAMSIQEALINFPESSIVLFDKATGEVLSSAAVVLKDSIIIGDNSVDAGDLIASAKEAFANSEQSGTSSCSVVK